MRCDQFSLGLIALSWKEPDISLRTFLKLLKNYISYSKLRRTLNLWWKKLRVGAHKFRVGYLIFDNFDHQYADFSLPWHSNSDKTNCILIATSRPFDLNLHVQLVNRLIKSSIHCIFVLPIKVNHETWFKYNKSEKYFSKTNFFRMLLGPNSLRDVKQGSY